MKQIKLLASIIISILVVSVNVSAQEVEPLKTETATIIPDTTTEVIADKIIKEIEKKSKLSVENKEQLREMIRKQIRNCESKDDINVVSSTAEKLLKKSKDINNIVTICNESLNQYQTAVKDGAEKKNAKSICINASISTLKQIQKKTSQTDKSIIKNEIKNSMANRVKNQLQKQKQMKNKYKKNKSENNREQLQSKHRRGTKTSGQGNSRK